MPVGEDHEDDYFGRQVIYRGPITIAANRTFRRRATDFDLQSNLQGCADAGLCYPPQKWTTRVEVPLDDAKAASRREGE